MRRRAFITLLGGAAVLPLATRAQQMASLPTVGFLGAGSPATADVWVSAFTSQLRELGWIEDRNIRSTCAGRKVRNDRSAEAPNKIPRMAWAMKVRGERFQAGHMTAPDQCCIT